MTPVEIVNARRVINGPSDNLRAVSYQRYNWVNPLWDKLLSNNWVVEQVTLTRDKVEYKDLTEGQKTAYMRAAAFLSNLDSIQTDNLSNNIVHLITDPGIRSLVYRQLYEEALHTRAYSNMIETVFESDPMVIYNLSNTVPELIKKNKLITDQGKLVTLQPTNENKILALVSNMILEGVYFFNGFLTFYAINRMSGKMQGSTDNIQYIQRDEETHLEIFINAFLSCKQENEELFTPDLYKKIKQRFVEAAELEANWGKFLIEKGLSGITEEIMDAYPRYLVNKRAAAIGIATIFPEHTNDPVPWVLEQYSNINNGKKNFFESKPLTYTETNPTFSKKKTRVRLTSGGDEVVYS